MAQRSKATQGIAICEHSAKERINSPPVGLVTPETDQDGGGRSYAPPHLDARLSRSGKAEHTSFTVPTASLHVYERIERRTVIEAVRKPSDTEAQGSLFSTPNENPPLRQAIEFYRHQHHWTNRLIVGEKPSGHEQLARGGESRRTGPDGLHGQSRRHRRDPSAASCTPMVGTRTQPDRREHP